MNVIENLTAFNTTYNSEHWFLFPYVLLAVSAFPYIIADIRQLLSQGIPQDAY